MFVRLKRFLFTYDWEVVEIQCASFKIAWGAWLLLPFQTFGGQSYRGLASIAPEVAWGIIILVIGLLHMKAVLGKSMAFRKIMIFIGFCFWLFMALIFALNRIESLMIPILFVIDFFLAMNYLRLSVPNIFRAKN